MGNNQPPFSIEFEATNICNTECLHCPHGAISRPMGKMDWDTFKTGFDLVAAVSDNLFVGFAGMGEPLLNPLIYQFIAYAHPKAHTLITSNASTLSTQNMQKLIDAGLDVLMISFNGIDKDLYELMMGGLNYERAQKNLQAALALSQGTHTEIAINLSVTRQTQDRLKEIQAFFNQLGIQNVNYSKCNNWGGSLKGDLVCKTPPPPVEDKRCDIFSDNVFVAWNGDVLSCCHDLAGENILGNLNTDAIDSILAKKAEITRQGVTFDICRNCNDLYRFAGDQDRIDRSLSQWVYDIYTDNPEAADNLTGDSDLSAWMLNLYQQEGKLQPLLRGGFPHKLQAENEQLRQETQTLRAQLDEITHYRLWQMMTSLHETRLKVIPAGSRREMLFHKIWRTRPAKMTRQSESPAPEPLNSLETIIQRSMAGRDLSSLFFIEIGAFDGVTNDPVYPLVKQHHWRGVLIEPQLEAFNRLKENYSGETQLQFVNAAIADQDGYRDLYTVRQAKSDLPIWSKQIASFNRDHLLKHANGIPEYGITEKIPDIAGMIQAEKVECLTLNSLLERFQVTQLDLLHIDAEGYDDEIIKRIDFNRIKPTIIQYEHMHLSPERRAACEAWLNKQGYHIFNGFADVIAYLQVGK